MFTIRAKCLFCDYQLDNKYFKKDLSIPVSVYNVDPETPLSGMSVIPYNIAICGKCGTGQTIYLGDLAEIYKVNHADSTGTTMKNMHLEFKKLIAKYSNDITEILEIGSSKGELADLIINDPTFFMSERNEVTKDVTEAFKEDLSQKYHIIEPSFFGDRKGKHIIPDFYENVDESSIPANTMIISHVYEHFYNPYEILDKISKNLNIKHFFLCFPDLEYYVQNDILHVLNTEHTYYADNNFIIELCRLKGFYIKEQEFYRGHSVFMHFVRNDGSKKSTEATEDKEEEFKEEFKEEAKEFPTNTSPRLRLDNYFSRIYSSVKLYNDFLSKSESKYKYIFPCSIHSIFLLTFGLDTSNLDGMLDNSPNKINKKVYGTNLLCRSFKEVLESKDTVSIVLNGGVFNKEIIPLLIDKPNIKYICV